MRGLKFNNAGGGATPAPLEPIVTNFSYTGTIVPYEVTKGHKYKLELWGAQGGHNSWAAGGKGGYTVGYITASSNTTWYVCVGGEGGNRTASVLNCTGGYNGGGSTVNCAWGGTNEKGSLSCGGGGASHIGLSNNLLADTSILDVIAVAGGGGGASGFYGSVMPICAGADGGGISGSNGIIGRSSSSSGSITACTGGTQSAGGSGGSGSSGNGLSGSFGQGASNQISSGNYTGGAGGGGLYGGGSGPCAYYTYCSGAGGSGYVGSLSDASTTSGIREGSGYITITENPESASTFYIYDKGSWSVPYDNIGGYYYTGISCEPVSLNPTNIGYNGIVDKVRVIGTSNKIDVTKYSMLKVKSYSNISFIKIYVTSSKDISITPAAQANGGIGNDYIESVVNVSSLTGEYYIVIWGITTAATGYVNEIYLE